MDRVAVEQWVQDYERLWRTEGTDRLPELFAADVAYRPSPWAEPVRGLHDLALFWEREREGADEEFQLSGEVIAVDAEAGVAVVRLQVEYDDAAAGTWRDLWVLGFDPDGRCSAFEEWPIAPDRLADVDAQVSEQ